MIRISEYQNLQFLAAESLIKSWRPHRKEAGIADFFVLCCQRWHLDQVDGVDIKRIQRLVVAISGKL